MDYKFTPTNDDHFIEVPYFEDAKADFAPYYTVGKHKTSTIQSAQMGVSTELAKLGAFMTTIRQGKYMSNGIERHGFEIYFTYGGQPGVIRVAGLPIRSETKLRRESVLIQALKIVADWIKAAVTAQVFAPGSDILIGHLLLPDGKTTIREHIANQQSLPLLPEPRFSKE